LFDDNNGIITTFAPSNLLIETHGVNDAGQIVGDVRIDSPQSRPYGFIYQAGTLTFLHVVGAYETKVNGINAYDQITETFDDQGSLDNLASPAFEVLPEAPNGEGTRPTGINTAGQVVGTYFENHSGVEHGFIYDNGTFSNIDFPGAQETEPMGINDFGQIVGYYRDGNTEHGFLDDHGAFVYFDIPGAIATRNTGINDFGQIVGYYNDASGHSHGFLRADPNYLG
jgi:probable HAF family extracellular repeat protein